MVSRIKEHSFESIKRALDAITRNYSFVELRTCESIVKLDTTDTSLKNDERYALTASRISQSIFMFSGLLFIRLNVVSYCEEYLNARMLDTSFCVETASMSSQEPLGSARITLSLFSIWQAISPRL